MTTLTILAAYVLGIFAFIAWDALVGFSFEFNGYDLPPLILPAIFWPIAMPIIMIAVICKKFAVVKENRIAKQKKREKMRIAAQKEIDKCMLEVEREFESSPARRAAP